MAPTVPDTTERPSRIPWPPLLLIGVVAGAVVLGRTCAVALAGTR